MKTMLVPDYAISVAETASRVGEFHGRRPSFDGRTTVHRISDGSRSAMKDTTLGGIAIAALWRGPPISQPDLLSRRCWLLPKPGGNLLERLDLFCWISGQSA